MDKIMKETEDLSVYNPPGSDLRKAQLKMLHILNAVDAICQKHQLTYWLSGGTLLGAVRHGGFIPWDDDLDIELMRNDYKKLQKILRKELPSDLSLQTPKEINYNLLISKVRDKNSEIIEDDECSSNYKQKGLFIDIFPEELSYKPLKDFVDFFYGRAFRRIKRGKPFHSLRYFYEFSVSILMWPFAVLFVYLARLICFLTKPKTVLHSYGIGNTTVHHIEYILPVSKIRFEDKEYNAPGNQDAYLSKQYGDYMKIPPKDKRPIHFNSVKFIR